LLPFSWNEERATLTRIERFSDGSTHRLEFSEADGGIHVDFTGQCDPLQLNRIVTRIFQLDRSVADFHAYCRTRAELAHVPHEKHGRFLCSPTLFEDTMKVLLTTNTTWAQTSAMVKRLVGAFGSPLQGSHSNAFPSPEQIASVPLPEFAEVARLGYRAPAAHSLACSVSEGDIDLESLRDTELDSDHVWKRLLALKGIGPYGAACLMLYLGRGDRLNVDSWARMLVSRELGRAVVDKDVHAFFADFGRWKGFAYSFYRWAGETPC